jgi:hypothetical protein
VELWKREAVRLEGHLNHSADGGAELEREQQLRGSPGAREPGLLPAVWICRPRLPLALLKHYHVVNKSARAMMKTAEAALARRSWPNRRKTLHLIAFEIHVLDAPGARRSLEERVHQPDRL